MNNLSFQVSNEKIKKEGIVLNGNIEKDIANTLNLFKNI